MVTEASGMDGRRDEVVAEREHLQKRGQSGNVAKVIGIEPLGKRRARGWFDADQVDVLVLSGHLVPREREGYPGKVRSPANAADNNVRVIVDHRELFPAFLADDRLVETD